jgi:peptide alpha-N-acetyltransferase
MAAIIYRQYTGEPDLPHIISLVEHELSEPYVIYTYRYFLNQWYALSLLPVCPARQLTPPHTGRISPS